MDQNATRHYRTRLLAMRADLAQQDSRGHDGQKTVMLDQQAVGRLSRMDALQQQAMAQATQARRDQLRRRIEAALARLDEAEYGYCTACGDQIAPKRLETDPTVPTCLSCAKG